MTGLFNDLLIVPLGIVVAVKLIPGRVKADLRVRLWSNKKPIFRAGLAVIVVIWLASIALVAWLIWPRFFGSS